jgi:hypothetical protein
MCVCVYTHTRIYIYIYIYISYFHFSVVVFFFFFLLVYFVFLVLLSVQKGNSALPYRMWQGRRAGLHVMCGRGLWDEVGSEGVVVVWGKKDDVLGKGTRPNVKNGTRKLNLNS